MKNLITIILLSLCPSLLFAENIDKATASKVAHNFFYERVSQYQTIDHKDISVSNIIEIKVFESVTIYAVNIYPKGYVLVSAFDNVRPVLAYSLDGKYSVEGHPPQFMDWLDRYHKQIRDADKNNIASSAEDRIMWERLRSEDISVLHPLKNEKDIEPLITTQWDQGQYYNEMCPADQGGPGGHCYAGCVATTLGQVVNYFRWPETGVGSYTYSCPPYGMLTGDFENTTYEWDKMATSLDKSNLAVALLLHHLGISCDMVYGPNGSGMYNHKAAYTLRTHFKYSPETSYVYRDSTTMDWDSLIVSHLDQKIPLYYAGWSVPNINGHAFVCDGYQAGNYYHFNWGWSGSFDGYFYTDNLNPGGSNFNLAQELVINGYPDTNLYTYPLYCQGDKTLDGTDGTIDDGSGPIYDYENNTSCSWLIAPTDSVENITIEFLKFNTENGDIVYIHDGENAAAPLLDFFTGTNLPDNVTSTADKLFITFHSDESGTADGWLLRYTSDIPVYCSGLETMTAQTESFSDGSGPRDYHNGTTCMWMIDPPDATEVTLYFPFFNTEELLDAVKVFDLETQELLAEYSGDITPAPVTSPSGRMFVTFSTNYTVTAPGWEAYYETDLVGIDEQNVVRDLEIFPNPATDQVNLSWTAASEGQITISVCNMSGSTLVRENFLLKSGRNTCEIELGELTAGIYLVKLTSAELAIYKKLIIK